MIKCPECGTLILTGNNVTENKTNKTEKEENNIMAAIIKGTKGTTKTSTKTSTKATKATKATEVVNAKDTTMQANVPVTLTIQDLATVLAPYLNGNKQGDTGSLAIGNTPNGELFAPNSKLHGTIMADGFIFNPYLHRRFLPANYLTMMNHRQGFEGCLRENYNFKYSLDYTRKEVRKLAFLQKNDKAAFAEGSQFFTLNVVKKIMNEYVTKVKTDIVCARKYDENYVVFNNRKYKNESPDLQNILNRLNVFAEQVNGANSYSKMQNILDGFNYIKVHKNTKKSQAFIHAYKKAGAYYTLKHLFMFEELEWESTPSASLATLRKLLDAGYEGYQFHAMLKELIKNM